MSSPTPTRHRPEERRSARRRLRLALGALVALAALGGVTPGTPAAAAPADCGVADVEIQFVCATYAAVAGRAASQSDVAYWEPRMPAQRTFFVATVARSAEGRHLVVERYFSRFYETGPTEAEHAFWDPLVTEPKGLRKLEVALLTGIPRTPEAFVAQAYSSQLGREPGPAELAYWVQRVEDTSPNKVAAQLSNSLEVRRGRVRGGYLNDLGYAPAEGPRAYWAERLRTGTSYLDFRIALRASPDAYATWRSCSAAAAPQIHDICDG